MCGPRSKPILGRDDADKEFGNDVDARSLLRVISDLFALPADFNRDRVHVHDRDVMHDRDHQRAPAHDHLFAARPGADKLWSLEEWR